MVAYFPPTDFVNYGESGAFFDGVVREVLGGRNPFLPALDRVTVDSNDVRVSRTSDPAKLTEHYLDIAPAYHVTSDDAPTLLLHGDADSLVPLQQSQLIAAKFQESAVPHKLYVKPGGAHGWPPTADEAVMIADWFDEYLE